ncbi:gephyrin-like molybdotransferase Glp [Alkalicoccus daliensis]|uniref:Molybdopterin molybdenumtransferase n=1 Tax=Alkalicoccus daliensis TaxID=745820 RepID=A0A1G9ZC84_9BACI|nr:gephyrin-like molybdotransferase Glp [Alkalicoccus daliensis]SDN18531.1 molybdopterin molybdochelatase [Alkalicoccus daliensis]
MLEARTPMKVSEAVEKVLQIEAVHNKTETVPLQEAGGRILAEAVIADAPVPPFNRSPLDGFAVRSADTKGAGRDTPVTLQVIETVGAGHVAEKVPQPGEAIRVMTGTIMPKETDAIVMFELTKEAEDGSAITITREFNSWDNVVIKGEEMEKGTVVLEAGERLHAGGIAALATFGYDQVQVTAKPVIGVFATGTELLEPGDPLEPGKIRNSNAPMVVEQLREAGAAPVYYGQLPDDFDLCYSRVQNVLGDVDALITTGGVSVGDFDFLPAIYEKLGAEVLFNKVAMRPGSVTTVAQWNGKPLFGLSGNPSACFVGFELFTGPWLRHSMGDKKPYLQQSKALLGSDFPKPNPFTRFVRGHITFQDGRLIATPAGLDKSQVVTSLSRANALIVLPGGTRGFQTGDQVAVLLLRGEGEAYFEEPVKDR